MTKSKLRTAAIIAGLTYTAVPCTNCGEKDHARPGCPHPAGLTTITVDQWNGLILQHVVAWEVVYEDSTSEWEVTVDPDGRIATFGTRSSTGNRWVHGRWLGPQPGDVDNARCYLIALAHGADLPTNEGSN